MFLAMTPELTEEERDRLANRVILAAWIITMLLFFIERCGDVLHCQSESNTIADIDDYIATSTRRDVASTGRR